MLDGLLGRPADDEGRTRFVDEDIVHLVDDGVMATAALHLVLDPHGHVVAQVVEPEFVVGAIEDVGPVGVDTLNGAEVLETAPSNLS